nr:hypothetical protein [Lachnospiraceae bacterium]
MKTKSKIIATMALSVLVAGTVYGIKSKAAFSNNDKDVSSYATGLELPTAEDIEWQEENVVKLNNADDYYDYMENGTDDVDKYVDMAADSAEDYYDKEESEYTFKNAVDNSTSKYFPAIGDQGSVGSCCSWAMAYYQFSYMYNKEFNRSSKNNDNLFSPMWTYEQAGPYDTRVANILIEMGAATLNDVPAVTKYNDEVHDGRSFAEGDMWKKALKYRVAEAYNIDINNPGMVIENNQSPYLDGIKAALNDGEILTFSTDINMWNLGDEQKIKYKIFDSNYKYTSNSKYEGEYIVTDYGDYSPKRGGHRMTIVGYDDNIWYDYDSDGGKDEDELGAFKIANSWGNWKNKGFIWVSYRTLNYRNVDGLEEKNHLMNSITGFKIKTKESKQFAKVELESDHLSQLDLEIFAYNNDGEREAFYTPVKFRGYFNSETFNADGVKKTGNLYFALDNAIEDISTEKLSDLDWQISVTDRSADENEHTVKKVQIINDDTNEVFNDDVDKESSFDGAIKTYHIPTLSKKSSNTTTIYYKGYDKPYIHYCVEGQNWTNVPGFAMNEDTSLDGYTHKYTIDLSNSSKVYVCFNDGNGNWDSGNGQNYTFEKGVYTYSNGKLKKIKDNKSDFAVSLKLNEVAPVSKKSTVKLTADSVNGSDVKYRFGVIINGESTYINDYSSNNTCEYTIDTTERLSFFVEAKSGDKTAKAGIHNILVNQFVINSLNFDVYAPTVLGTTITLTPYVSNERTLNGIKNKYVYTAELDGTVYPIETIEKNKGKWVPTKKGNYKIKLTVTDGLGDTYEYKTEYRIIEDDLSFRIEDVSFYGYDSETIVKGYYTTMNVLILGGKSPYKYSAGYIDENGNDVYTVENVYYSYFSAPTPYVGDITYFVEATDDNNETVRKEFKKHIYGCEITGVDTSVPAPAHVGDTVLFTVNTKYETDYRGSNRTTIEITNTKTGVSDSISASSYFKDNLKYQFTEAGLYEIKVLLNTYGSGLCTYSFMYEVKPEEDVFKINKINTNIASPALVGNAITFELDTNKYVEEGVYTITNKADNTSVVLKDTPIYTADKATWHPQVAGTYTIDVTAKCENQTATLSTEFVINNNPDDNKMVTIFYKGYKTPYIHYRTNNSSWTNVPGMAMNTCDYYKGYTHVATIDLNGGNELVACFNDGNGNWDSANGRNYKFSAGRYTYENGEIKPVGDVIPDDNDSLTLYY